VYQDLLTQRSEFFRAARLERWSHDPAKPTTLDDVEVELFSAYLHCLNFGGEPLAFLVQSMMDENELYQRKTFYMSDLHEIHNNDSDNDIEAEGSNDIDGTNSGSSSSNDGGGVIEVAENDLDGAASDGTGNDKENSSTLTDFSWEPVEKFLIDLYLLADKLIDPITANLAMDELIRVIEKRDDHLSDKLIRFAYESTTAASPLRKLLRNFSIVGDIAMPTNVEHLEHMELPSDYIRDVLFVVLALNRGNAGELIQYVYYRRELQPYRYHQVVDKIRAPASEEEYPRVDHF
jgi:hypothetical protein